MGKSGVAAGAVVRFTPELLRERNPEGKPNKKRRSEERLGNCP
jgi:hypothetical protein